MFITDMNIIKMLNNEHIKAIDVGIAEMVSFVFLRLSNLSLTLYC